MALQIVTVKLTGVAPLMPQSVRLADPRSEVFKEIKKILSKPSKQRSDEDVERLGELEWLGGFYLGQDGEPILPGENIEAALARAATSVEKGLKDKIKAGVIVSDSKIAYKDAPLSKAQKLDKYRLVKMMKTKTKDQILKTRPIIPDWSATVKIHVNTSLVSVDKMISCLRYVGEVTAILGSRPKYGRFDLEVVK